MELYPTKIICALILMTIVLFSCKEERKNKQNTTSYNVSEKANREHNNTRDFVRFPNENTAKSVTRPSISNEHFVTRLDDLFANYVPKDEKFTINPADESFLETENGTKLYFQPESFLTINGTIVSDSAKSQSRYSMST